MTLDFAGGVRWEYLFRENYPKIRDSRRTERDRERQRDRETETERQRETDRDREILFER